MHDRAMDLASLPFMRAQHFRKWLLPTRRPVDVIGMHSAECFEHKGEASAIGRYFMAPGVYPPSYPIASKRGQPIVASAHAVVDDSSVIQCVQWDDVAYAAPPMNDVGIHIELCGWAKQSADEWDDEYSRREIALAAELVAAICDAEKIPATWLDDDALRFWKAHGPGSIKGITDHATISRVFRVSDHTDPGPNFPRVDFIERVQNFLPYPTG